MPKYYLMPRGAKLDVFGAMLEVKWTEFLRCNQCASWQTTPRNKFQTENSLNAVKSDHATSV